MGRAVFRPKLAVENEMTKRFLRGELTRRAGIVRSDIGQEFAGDIQAEARGDFKESPKPGRINRHLDGTKSKDKCPGSTPSENWAQEDTPPKTF